MATAITLSEAQVNDAIASTLDVRPGVANFTAGRESLGLQELWRALSKEDATLVTVGTIISYDGHTEGILAEVSATDTSLVLSEYSPKHGRGETLRKLAVTETEDGQVSFPYITKGLLDEYSRPVSYLAYYTTEDGILAPVGVGDLVSYATKGVDDDGNTMDYYGQLVLASGDRCEVRVLPLLDASTRPTRDNPFPGVVQGQPHAEVQLLRFDDVSGITRLGNFYDLDTER